MDGKGSCGGNGCGQFNGGAGISNGWNRQRYIPVVEEVLKPMHWWHFV